MSNTPQTDEIERELNGYYDLCDHDRYENMTEHARELESERDALRKALELARPYVSAASIRMYDGWHVEGIRHTARDRLVAIDAALNGTAKQEPLAEFKMQYGVKFFDELKPDQGRKEGA